MSVEGTRGEKEGFERLRKDSRWNGKVWKIYKTTIVKKKQREILDEVKRRRQKKKVKHSDDSRNTKKFLENFPRRFAEKEHEKMLEKVGSR